MCASLESPARRLGDLEREVLLKAAAREAADSETGSIPAGAGLPVEMLGFYDALRRRHVSINSFERLLPTWRGTPRSIAAPSVFCGKRTFSPRLFEVRGAAGYDGMWMNTRSGAPSSVRASPSVAARGRHGRRPHGRRRRVLACDFDLLARLPLLERVDIIATHATLGAGFLDRLQNLMPGFEEAEMPGVGMAIEESSQPVIVGATMGRPSPSAAMEQALSASRDAGVPGSAALDRRAVVFKRPLPYLYLAHDVFASAGFPYQTFDALPLAAEPSAASLDLVFEFVISQFTRDLSWHSWHRRTFGLSRWSPCGPPRRCRPQP